MKEKIEKILDCSILRDIVDSKILSNDDSIEITIKLKKTTQDILQEFIESLTKNNINFELKENCLYINDKINFFFLKKICSKIEELYPNRRLEIEGGQEYDDEDGQRYICIDWYRDWEIL